MAVQIEQHTISPNGGYHYARRRDVHVVATTGRRAWLFDLKAMSGRRSSVRRLALARRTPSAASGAEVVEESGELLLLPLPCGSSYAIQDRKSTRLNFSHIP